MRTDPKFPKTVKAQIRFIGDSLAGLGRVAPRTSRDICAEGRKKQHIIIRQDYDIECTCGYEGPAKPGALAVKRKLQAKKFLTVLVMAFTSANRLVTPTFVQGSRYLN